MSPNTGLIDTPHTRRGKTCLHEECRRLRCQLKEYAGKLSEANSKIARLDKSLQQKVGEHTKELQLAHEEVLTLYTLGKKMVSTLNPSEVFGMIVKTVSMLMDAEASSVMLLNDRQSRLIIKSSWGLGPRFENRLRSIKAQKAVLRMLEDRQPCIIPNLREEADLSFRMLSISHKFRSIVMVPIVFNDVVLGAIATYSRRRRIFIEKEIELLQAFASQAAIAVNNARLHENLSLSHYNTINTLSLALEARDPYTRGHAERVTNYSIGLGRALKLDKIYIDILRYAGKIHDIGKIGVSDMILLKPGRLTPSERAQVELHPARGVDMISHLKFLEPGIPVIKHHHERFDGSGYPDALKGDEIPIGARILAIADAFDAMTSERPYRSALAFEEAIDDLRKSAGSQFDPELVGYFLKVLARRLPQ